MNNMPQPLFLMLLLGVTHGDLILRPNYGLVMEGKGHLANGQSQWIYTFAIDHIQQPSIVRPFQLCAEEDLSSLKGRHRRNYLVALEMCREFEDLHRTYQKLNVSLNENIRMYQQAVKKLARVDFDDAHEHRRRTKRALVPAVGSILGSAFGLITTKMHSRLALRVQELESDATNQAKFMERLKERMVSVVELTQQRLNNVSHNVVRNAQALKILANQTNKLFDELVEVHLESDANKILTRNLLKLSYATFASLNHLQALQMVEDSAKTRLLALQALANNKLSPFLVHPDHVKKALRTVARTLRLKYPEYKLLYDQPGVFYTVPSVSSYASDKRLYVDLRIPLSVNSENSVFQMYELSAFPVPVNLTNLHHMTQVRGFADYLGISRDRNFFIELSQDQFERCFGGNVKQCTRMHAERPIEKYSCAVALYEDNLEKITKACKIDYRISEDPVKFVYDLRNSSFLVSGHSGPWLAQCGSETAPKAIPICTFCVLTLGCRCSLRSEHFQLPPSIQACNRKSKDPVVVKSFTTNLLFYQNFYNKTQLKNITGSTLLPEPLNLTAPDLDLHIMDTTNYVKADKTIVADLTQTIATLKDDSIPYLNPYGSWILSEGTELLSNQYATHIGIGNSIFTLIVFIWLVIITRNLHNLQRSILLLHLSTHVAKAEELKPPTFVIPASINLSNFLSMLCVVLALTWFFIKKVRNIYQNRHSVGSVMRFFDRTPPRPSTRLVLEVYSGTSMVILEVAKFSTPPACLSVRVGNAPPEIEMMFSCIQSHLLIDWKQTTVFDTLRQLPYQLPSVLVVPFHLKFLTKTVLAAPHVANLLTGNDGYFTVHNLPTDVTLASLDPTEMTWDEEELPNVEPIQTSHHVSQLGRHHKTIPKVVEMKAHKPSAKGGRPTTLFIPPPVPDSWKPLENGKVPQAEETFKQPKINQTLITQSTHSASNPNIPVEPRIIQNKVHEV